MTDKLWSLFIYAYYSPCTTYCGCLALQVDLQKPVKADGNVEVWLMSLMKMAHFSLHVVIRTAAMAIQDSNFQLLEFLNMFPAQVKVLEGVLSSFFSFFFFLFLGERREGSSTYYVTLIWLILKTPPPSFVKFLSRSWYAPPNSPHPHP